MLKVPVWFPTVRYFSSGHSCIKGLCAFSVVQVANTKKETDFKWYKDSSRVKVEDLPDLQKGECHLSIPKVLYHLPITNYSFCLTRYRFARQRSKPAVTISLNRCKRKHIFYPSISWWITIASKKYLVLLSAQSSCLSCFRVLGWTLSHFFLLLLNFSIWSSTSFLTVFQFYCLKWIILKFMAS